jgi:hypothetical protein
MRRGNDLRPIEGMMKSSFIQLEDTFPIFGKVQRYRQNTVDLKKVEVNLSWNSANHIGALHGFIGEPLLDGVPEITQRNHLRRLRPSRISRTILGCRQEMRTRGRKASKSDAIYRLRGGLRLSETYSA